MIKLIRLILVSLLLISLPKSLMAQDLSSISPAPTHSFTDDQLKNVSDSLVNGQKCSVDLSLTQGALQSCIQDVVNSQPGFWQDPKVEIAGVTVVFAVGTVFGLTKCFGLCN